MRPRGRERGSVIDIKRDDTGASTTARLLCAIAALAPPVLVIVFVASYNTPFPVNDQWGWSLPVAVAAERGGPSPAEFFTMTGGGHRTVFTHLHTAIFARWASWRTDLEAYLNPAIALLNLYLLYRLFLRRSPRLAPWVAIPFSILVFSIFQHLNWTMSWQTAWHFVNLFLLGALLSLASRPVGWVTLCGAAALAVCATFSRGHGFLVWPAVLPVLWARGYRWYQSVAWAACGAVAFAAYFRGGGILVGFSQNTWKSVDLGHPIDLLRLLLEQLGSSMAYRSHALAVVVGAAGVALWLANVIHARRTGVARETLAVWVALAGFAVATAWLIAASRREVYDLSLWGGYTTTAILFWIGWIAVAAPATFEIFAGKNAVRPGRVLGIANVAAASVLFVLFLGSNAQTLQEWADYYGNALGETRSPHIEATATCLRRFPLTESTSCFCEEVHWVRRDAAPIYRLASCAFSPFSAIEPEPLLPGTRVAGSPVLVAVPSDGVAVYADRWMLQDVSPERTFYVARERVVAPGGCVESIPENLTAGFSEELFATLRELAGTSGEIWFVTTTGAGYDTAVFERLEAFGYDGSPVAPSHTRYRDSRFRIYRFGRDPSPD